MNSDEIYPPYGRDISWASVVTISARSSITSMADHQAALPKKWKKQQLYSWRYDPRELSPAAAAPERDQRRRNARADAMEA